MLSRDSLQFLASPLLRKSVGSKNNTYVFIIVFVQEVSCKLHNIAVYCLLPVFLMKIAALHLMGFQIYVNLIGRADGALETILNLKTVTNLDHVYYQQSISVNLHFSALLVKSAQTRYKNESAKTFECFTAKEWQIFLWKAV